jgi:hypothetical protein
VTNELARKVVWVCYQVFAFIGAISSVPVRNATMGYLMTVRMHSYDNPNGVREDGRSCDPGVSNKECDVFIKLRVRCSPCSISEEVVYPGEPTRYYENTASLDETQFGSKNITVLFNDSLPLNLRIIIAAWDWDNDVILSDKIDNLKFWFPLRSIKAARKYTAGNVRQSKVFTDTNNETFVTMSVSVTFGCDPRTCGSRCQWPTNFAVCEDNYFVCTTTLFHEDCDYVKGYYVHKLTLTNFEFKQSSSDELCSAELSVCVTNDGERCKDNWWKKITGMWRRRKSSF